MTSEKAPTNSAPIGMLLRTDKNEDMMQYALSGMPNNLFVSRDQSVLPVKEEIAAFLHRATIQTGVML